MKKSAILNTHKKINFHITLPLNFNGEILMVRVENEMFGAVMVMFKPWM
ncbi:hypothetical protein [Cyclobacterium qasimii]|uniref:Uncharacterized protein n=1 Tax=Cyclobacterium qasimii M12-11B TaxID=641524 RepID=S7WZM7_9BACT|nr:hypothetical protein [Cyclobacterium qasimii]EPR69363.1 hypothetical protein ADICYQ_1608 [Cyclobacterium qasimii M12-11B]